MRRILRRTLPVFVFVAALVATPLSSAGAWPWRPPTPTQPPPPPPPSCGSVQIAKPTGGYWTCTFGDDFNGTSLDTTKWAVQNTAGSGFHSGPECFVNSPDNIKVSGGYLNLTVRKEAAPFSCASPTGAYTTQYTSGMVFTYGKFSQTYGRFEVNAKFPAQTVAGLQESLWLFPVNYAKFGLWPLSGEIDIAEQYSAFSDRVIPYVHYVPSFVDYNVTNNKCYLTSNAFHSYAVEWTASTITVIYDGKTCITDTWNPASPLLKPEPFNQPFFLSLTQALGIGANAFNAATTPLPATTQVDYVRVWK